MRFANSGQPGRAAGAPRRADVRVLNWPLLHLPSAAQKLCALMQPALLGCAAHLAAARYCPVSSYLCLPTGNKEHTYCFGALHTNGEGPLDISGATGASHKRDVTALLGARPGQLLEQCTTLVKHRHEILRTHQHEMR